MVAYTVHTAAEIATNPDLADWRYTLSRIEAQFRSGSFGSAAALAAAIADVADGAGHHPDIDLRYPDVVRVALTTHAIGGAVTDRDVALARTIADLAAERGARSEPLTLQASEVALDALDIAAVLPFWRAVLGYVDVPAGPDDGPAQAIRDPLRIGPPLWFQQMDEPRPQRNRFHLDVIVPHDVAQERLAAALAAGGTLVSDRHARAWWVLADAEGNEACICTWQDRDGPDPDA